MFNVHLEMSGRVKNGAEIQSLTSPTPILDVDMHRDPTLGVAIPGVGVYMISASGKEIAGCSSVPLPDGLLAMVERVDLITERLL